MRALSSVLAFKSFTSMDRPKKVLISFICIALRCSSLAQESANETAETSDPVEARFSQFGPPNRMQVVFRWTQLTYESESSDDRFVFPSHYQSVVNSPTENANFIQYNNVPMGVEAYKGNRLFITVPRRRPGVPSTLNYVDISENQNNRSPPLKPFPDAQTSSLPTAPNPNQIVSVYRTRIDECERLWFVDTGMLEIPDNLTEVQQASIWVWDLKRNRRAHRFEFPEDLLDQGTGLASITVDVDRNSCDRAFAYVPDLVNGNLFVFSLRENRAWRFSHNYFHFSPLEGEFQVAGLQYQWDDNIFSVTLGPRQPDGFRSVFFHPMVSTNEFVVSSRVLQNSALSARAYHGNDFSLYGNRGPFTQTAMHQYDPTTGVIFYAQVGRNAIGCWNSKRPFNAFNHAVVARDDEKMIYPSDLHVDPSGTLWVFTNTMPRFIYSRLDTTQINFRIWRGQATDIIRDTICQN